MNREHAPDRPAGEPSLVVVHRTQPAFVRQTVDALIKSGLAPIVLDNPSPSVLHATGWTYLVQIAVPAEQETRAREAIEAWARDGESAVSRHERAFAWWLPGHLLFAAVPTLIVYLVWREAFLAFCVLVFMLIAEFLALALLGSIKAASRRGNTERRGRR